MKVLVIGGGGREHAIVQSLAKSDRIEKMYCAPGNAGIAEYAECVSIGVMEFEKLVSFAKEKSIDYAVVAPDDPLALGCCHSRTFCSLALQNVICHFRSLSLFAYPKKEVTFSFA